MAWPRARGVGYSFGRDEGGVAAWMLSLQRYKNVWDDGHMRRSANVLDTIESFESSRCLAADYINQCFIVYLLM